jgi:excisionase family DNA binding protein
MTKRQLADYLGKSERTIDNWREQIGLPYMKVKRSVLFRLSDVLRHLDKHNVGPTDWPDTDGLPKAV